MATAPDPRESLLAREIAAARRFAALSGPFAPADALEAAEVGLPKQVADRHAALVASELAKACDTHAGPDGRHWLMRLAERRWELGELRRRDLLIKAIAKRRGSGGLDARTLDLINALLGNSDFEAGSLETLLAELGEESREDIPDRAKEIADALEWAGPGAPAFRLLDRLRALINRAGTPRPESSLIGRDSELQGVRAWIAKPSDAGPIRALLVTGVQGIGKSALLEKAVAEAGAHGASILPVRLDFDRSMLSVLDQNGLTLELARQIANQMPETAEDIRALRVRVAALAGPAFGNSGRGGFPYELAAEIGRVISEAARSVVMILDTFEALRWRGETHPGVLFEWLDELVASGIAPMSVIAAGHPDSFDSIPDRIGEKIVVEGLGPRDSDSLLAENGTPAQVGRSIRELAVGRPAVLKLAAAAFSATAPIALAAFADHGTTPQPDRPTDTSQLLSGIADEGVRQLTAPGLLVRRISVEVVRDVLLPILRRDGSGAGDATRLFDGFKSLTWLLAPDPKAPEWLRPLPGIRGLLVPMFYATNPQQCARVDRAASEWFEKRTEPWLALEALYHRLQLVRAGEELPHVDPDLAPLFDEAALSELVTDASDAVRQARGERSSYARTASGSAAPSNEDPRATRDLQIVTERGDWIEANDIYERVFRDKHPSPTSQAANAIRTFLWRTGRWRLARQQLEALEAIAPGDHDLVDLRQEDALARLEMRAELGFSRFVGRLSEDPNHATTVRRVSEGGSQADLTSGALGFALYKGKVELRRPRQRVDPVSATVDVWSDGGGDAKYVAFSAAEERMRRRAPRMIERVRRPRTRVELRSSDSARLLAALSPYVQPLCLLLRLEQREPPIAHARELLRAMARGEAGWNAELDGSELPSSFDRENPIEWMSDIGLFSEWAGSYAFSHDDSDIGAIALHAERWRRTTAGWWSYDEPPPNWKGWERREGPDATLAGRLSALMTADKKIALSTATLRWWGTDTPSAPSASRLDELTRIALQESDLRSQDKDALSVAERLTEYGTPIALVPALAVLSAPGTDSVERSRRQQQAMRQMGLDAKPRVRKRTSTNANSESVAGPRRPVIQPRGDFMTANAESTSRLEGLRVSSPKMFEATEKALEEDRIRLDHLGLSKQQLLNAVRNGPSALEAAGASSMVLEAIVRRTGRPPLLVRNNKVELEALDALPAGTAGSIKAVEAFIPSVGRIEFINHDMAWGGTGWVVGKKGKDHLVLTNRHVAKLIARRLPDGTAVFGRAPLSGARYAAQVDFNEEVGATSLQARVGNVIEISYLADDLAADMALFKVRKVDGDWKMPDPLPLANAEAKAKELVALVGYPAYDSRNDKTAMSQYFRDLYDVKRLAPGLVMKQTAQAILSHDCTSLGGNSGSPLISLEQKKIVGLHFAGEYGIGNSAVGVTTIKRLLKGNLVTVGTAKKSLATEARADGVHKPAELKGRSGYDPDFLGAAKFRVAWPKLPQDIAEALVKPSDATKAQPNELRYTNFGVLFSRTFKLPVVTAVNINGKESVRIKRGDDKWFRDGRIDLALQHGQEGYKDQEIDRGHMVRREDPNWGKLAKRADLDTFHYTNSAPQHSRLNQGKELWQGLENYILDSARTDGFKACVFTGPVYSEDDEFFKPENIRVPLEFWKVVAMIDADRKKLHATAYLLSQGQLIRKLLEKRSKAEAIEGVVLGAYRTFQISIADLEEATDYDFGVLRRADPLAATTAGREAAAAAVPIVVSLETPRDLVL